MSASTHASAKYTTEAMTRGVAAHAGGIAGDIWRTYRFILHCSGILVCHPGCLSGRTQRTQAKDKRNHSCKNMRQTSGSMGRPVVMLAIIIALFWLPSCGFMHWTRENLDDDGSIPRKWQSGDEDNDFAPKWMWQNGDEDKSHSSLSVERQFCVSAFPSPIPVSMR
jgi:hypothetical protein